MYVLVVSIQIGLAVVVDKLQNCFWIFRRCVFVHAGVHPENFVGIISQN